MTDDFTLEDAQSAIDNAPYHAIRILRREISDLRAKLAEAETVVREEHSEGWISTSSYQRIRAVLAAVDGPAEPAIYAEHHVVQFTDDGWTIAHPLRERLDLDSLFDCQIRWSPWDESDSLSLNPDPGVRGRFVLNDDGTLGPEVSARRAAVDGPAEGYGAVMGTSEPDAELCDNPPADHEGGN